MQDKPIEMKIALFSLIVAAIGFVCSKFVNDIGQIIELIALVTFFATVLVYFYRLIFGEIGVTTWFSLICFYIAAIGTVLKKIYIWRIGEISTDDIIIGGIVMGSVFILFKAVNKIFH